jgi:DNA-binding NarL/FixJ family response regulator
LSLPELEGLELLSILAKEGNLCTVVAISSHFEYFDLKSFLRTPLVGVLSKRDPENFVKELLILTDLRSTKSSIDRGAPVVETLINDTCADESNYN